MKKKLLGIISFSITVAVLIGFLKLMNLLPHMIEQGIAREYSSIEEVSSKLGISDIYVPSYFPEPLSWPPSKIFAQKKPFEAVVMEFGRASDSELALIIIESQKQGFAEGERLGLKDINEKTPYALGSKKTLLEVGVCEDRLPCSRISWEEGGKHISLTMRSKPIELIRIAESMSR